VARVDTDRALETIAGDASRIVVFFDEEQTDFVATDHS
jgi:hypothetical protein